MGKVILITGASSGMGKETAVKLIREGHTVYAVARRVEQMQDLQEMGGHPMAMDVTNEADIQRVVDAIMQREGKIDVLWNNAGYGLYGSVEDVPLAEARKQMEVNLFGLAAGTKNASSAGGSSKPSIIADTVSKIISTDRPKTRYRVGKFAKPMVWMRIYLGDRLFDRILKAQL